MRKDLALWLILVYLTYSMLQFMLDDPVSSCSQKVLLAKDIWMSHSCFRGRLRHQLK